MRKFLIWTLALSIGIIGLSSCSRDNDNPGKYNNGKNDIVGKSGNIIHSGQGTPDSTLGNIGDYYLAEDTEQLYGPKSDKGWGTPQSLGKNGADGKDGSQILKGNTPPNTDLGKNGDWYIDVAYRKIYYKNANAWKMEIDLGNNSTPNSLKGDYILSKDGTTLYFWFNKELNNIDMQADPELSRVTTIGAYAFRDYSELTQIKLPNGLKKIGNDAFFGSGLTSITIPNSVTSIGEYAFAAGKLISVTIPNSVTNIGEEAFSDNRLTSITIPSSVKSIGWEAFASNQLTSVRVEAKTPPTAIGKANKIQGWSAFSSYNNNNLVISVPQQSVEAYKQAEGWKEYADKIQGY